jgi:hypothetical protein
VKVRNDGFVKEMSSEGRWQSRHFKVDSRSDGKSPTPEVGMDRNATMFCPPCRQWKVRKVKTSWSRPLNRSYQRFPTGQMLTILEVNQRSISPP